MDCDLLGKATPVGETGLELVIADLLVARAARPASAAGADEGHGDPVAHAPPGHECALGRNNARELMARHMRQPEYPGRAPSSRANRFGRRRWP